MIAGKISPSLVTHTNSKAPAAEAFRMLRTNLQFLSLDKPLRSLMVTSATPEEGKSFSAANIAVAYAQTGVRTCLVDADLRRPKVAKLFGRQRLTGLTTALVKDIALGESVQDTDVPGLWVLGSGPIPPNPAELLASHKMHSLMDRLAESYDMVVYDVPPVLAVADPTVLAPRIDGVILVVGSGLAKRDEVRRATEALNGVRANLIGAVLNGARRESSSTYYQYYSAR